MPSFLDDNMLKLLIGIGSAAIAAILTQLATAYSANRRIKEVELVYQQKLRDSYLENARKVTGEVYLPISIALTQLSNSYAKFKISIDFEAETSPADPRAEFLVDCTEYLDIIDNLVKRGGDAYLTTDLDEKLRRFNSFLRESASTYRVVTKLILEANLSTFPFQSGAFRLARETDDPTITRVLSRLGMRNVSLRMVGIGLNYSRDVLAAPVDTREFEERILADVIAIKILIKEVILGSQHSS